jgi:hypothetical protein
LTSFFNPNISLSFIATLWADLQHRSGGKPTLSSGFCISAFPFTTLGSVMHLRVFSMAMASRWPIGGCHERFLQFVKGKNAGDLAVEKK